MACNCIDSCSTTIEFKVISMHSTIPVDLICALKNVMIQNMLEIVDTRDVEYSEISN